MHDNWRSIQGKTAIVTGGAQGIGAGICKSLFEAGANIMSVDLQGDKLSLQKNSAVYAKSNSFVVYQADLSTQQGCKKLIDEAINRFGCIDILINCAAPGRNKDFIKSLSLEEWDIHHKVVIQAPILLAELAVNHLAKNGNGVIVNISSVLASVIALEQASLSYHVSKSGLQQLTKWMAVKFGGLGIRVNSIAPGLVDREEGKKLSDDPRLSNLISEITPLRRPGLYKDIGDAVLFLCSDSSSYITGQVLTVDGGLGLVETFGVGYRVSK
jgi:3-oxoacyl-[acyl-carrier protein] reductase